MVGTRGIGRRHGSAIAADPRALVHAAAAATPESAEAFARDFGASVAVTDYRKLVRRDGLDAAIICTPNHLHHRQARAFLDSGKDVLLEKPMALNARQARDLAETARRNRRILMVGHMWRFDPEVQWLKSVIGQGLIGKVVRTHASGIHAGWGPTGWFTDQKRAGGGALADMGVHGLDSTRFVLGDPRARRVYAEVRTAVGDYDVDDTAVVMIDWKSGPTSVIEAGWRHPRSERPYPGLQVYGAEGYVSLFPTELKIKLSGRAGAFTPAFPSRSRPCPQSVYDAQISHFIDCVLTRRVPQPSPRSACHNQEILDAAYASARRGRAMKWDRPTASPSEVLRAP